MKQLAIMVSTILSLHSLCAPAMAEVPPLTASENNDAIGSVSGRATIKVIGPLHLSEGLVIMSDNKISILSDPTDPITEAELKGQLLHAHAVGNGANRIIKGVAIFTGGYSIKALDSSQASESIQAKDGTKYVGHILDATPTFLRISTNNGVKIIRTGEVTEISSPKAFEFSIAPNGASSSVSADTPSNQISFNPTAQQNATPALHVSTVHKQLAQSHLKRRLLTAGLVVTGAAACVAIPLGISVANPRPQH